jgi:hypothetical protein
MNLTETSNYCRISVKNPSFWGKLLCWGKEFLW